LGDLGAGKGMILQEVLGRTNRLLSSDMTRTAQKTMRATILLFLSAYSLPSNDRGINRQTHRQQGDLINPFLVFENMESRLKTIHRETDYEDVNWIHFAQNNG
jgi:hypothetical protein